MRYLLFTIIVLFCATTTYGEIIIKKTDKPEPAQTNEAQTVSTNNILITPEMEAMDAVKFLESIAPEDRIYIQLFSTYSIPADEVVKAEDGEIKLVDAAVLSFRFWIHSLSSAFNFVQPKQVSPTLWAIDIRDYGWTPEAMEKVAQLDPYFREPWVTNNTASKLRLLARNSILRMDWFIVHSSNPTRQLDRGIDVFPYYELLYARHGIPKTTDEMRKVWGFDNAQATEFRVLRGNVIDESIVALHNRQINRARTSTGYWWETNDVKDTVGGKDYVENLDPTIRVKDKDAGEVIATNYIGLQVYGLFDAANNRIEFADNAIAVDGTDQRDKRVRTARSCVLCHPKGINHASNDIVKILDASILRVHDKVERNILDGFFVNNNLTELINDDQLLYARAVKQANGLTPEVNTTYFGHLLEWYDKNINQEQAALEWGVSVDTLKEKLAPSTSARLLGLIKDIPVTRASWEEVKGGIFGNGMLVINGLQPVQAPPQEIIKEEPEQPEEPAPVVEEPEIPKPKATVLQTGARIMNGEEEVGIIPAGTVIDILDERPNWISVKYNDMKGWIASNSVRKEGN